MLKRKRAGREGGVGEKISSLRQELYKALKTAKGFERQRQAKRLRESGGVAEKTRRLENEVAVLKSLDLQQAAHAHLCASLLKIRAVAESPLLPNEIKAGVSRPDVSEEERAALHNVTSALYNRAPVRAAIDKAVTAICGVLGVSPPEKKKQGKKGKTGAAADEQRRKQDEDPSADSVPPQRAAQPAKIATNEPTTTTTTTKKLPAPEDDVSSDDEDEVDAVTRLEAVLGGSSDDEQSDSEADDELDPMAITSDEGDGADSEDADLDLGGLAEGDGEEGDEWSGIQDTEDEDEKGESGSDEGSTSSSSEGGLTPPPSKKRAVADKSETAGARAGARAKGPTGSSTFLPSLMGGYVSGSESASDVDVGPPRRNRRGQRARQAIWEKRYKEKAKHLGKEKKRDSSKYQGWDPRRGAVDEHEGSKPWKRGVRNPLERRSRANPDEDATNRATPKARSDDTGPLHPSWEARKKAKEKEETATFQGKKITFD